MQNYNFTIFEMFNKVVHVLFLIYGNLDLNLDLNVFCIIIYSTD